MEKVERFIKIHKIKKLIEKFTNNQKSFVKKSIIAQKNLLNLI